MHASAHTHAYTFREREEEREGDVGGWMEDTTHTHIHTQREGGRELPLQLKNGDKNYEA